MRFLDVSCGQGTRVIRLARAGHQVNGLDPSPELLERFRVDLDDPAPMLAAIVQCANDDGLSALLDAERTAGVRDPYRQVAALLHLVYGRSAADIERVGS